MAERSRAWQQQLIAEVITKTRYLLLKEFQGGHLSKLTKQECLKNWLVATAIAEMFRVHLDEQEQDEIDLMSLEQTIRQVAREAAQAGHGEAA